MNEVESIHMNYLAIALAVLGIGTVVGCGGPDESVSYEVTRLSHASHFVGAVLVPDAERKYPQEMFVGRVVPIDYPGQPPACSDSLLRRLMFALRAEYRMGYEGYTDASVSIEDESGTIGEFRHIGGGIYRMGATTRPIVHQRTYLLRVKRGAEEVTGTTTIPGSFRFLNVYDSAMVFAPLTLTPAGDSQPMIRLRWTRSTGRAFYANTFWSSESGVVATSHTLDTSDISLAVPFPGVERKSIEMFAADENFGRMYIPHYDWSRSDAFDAYFMHWDSMSLEERSSTNRPGEWPGFIGSAAIQRASFSCRNGR